MLYELLTRVSTVRASNFVGKKSLSNQFVMLTTISTETSAALLPFSSKLPTDMKCILARELYNVDCLESDSKTLRFIYGLARRFFYFFPYIFSNQTSI